MNGGAVAKTYLQIAAAKTSLDVGQAFFRGLLCNVLVCMAVWMAFAGRSIVDKFIAIVKPISAFVAAGFEHSIANMYFIPMGLFLKNETGVAQVAGLSREQLSGLDLHSAVNNIVAATLGNIVGGAVLVGLVYWFVYLHPDREAK